MLLNIDTVLCNPGFLQVFKPFIDHPQFDHRQLPVFLTGFRLFHQSYVKKVKTLHPKSFFGARTELVYSVDFLKGAHAHFFGWGPLGNLLNVKWYCCVPRQEHKADSLEDLFRKSYQMFLSIFVFSGKKRLLESYSLQTVSYLI